MPNRSNSMPCSCSTIVDCDMNSQDIPSTIAKPVTLNARRFRRLFLDRQTSFDELQRNRRLRWQVSHPTSSLSRSFVDGSGKMISSSCLDVTVLRRIRNSKERANDVVAKHSSIHPTTDNTECKNAHKNDATLHDVKVETSKRLDNAEFLSSRFRSLARERERRKEAIIIPSQTLSSSLEGSNRLWLRRELSALSSGGSASSSISLYDTYATSSLSSRFCESDARRQIPGRLSILLHQLSFNTEVPSPLPSSSSIYEIPSVNLNNTFLLELGRLMERIKCNSEYVDVSVDSTNSSVSSLASEPPCLDVSSKGRALQLQLRLLFLVPLLLLTFFPDVTEHGMCDLISKDFQRTANGTKKNGSSKRMMQADIYFLLNTSQFTTKPGNYIRHHRASVHENKTTTCDFGTFISAPWRASNMSYQDYGGINDDTSGINKFWMKSYLMAETLRWNSARNIPERNAEGAGQNRADFTSGGNESTTVESKYHGQISSSICGIKKTSSRAQESAYPSSGNQTKFQCKFESLLQRHQTLECPTYQQKLFVQENVVMARNSQVVEKRTKLSSSKAPGLMTRETKALSENLLLPQMEKRKKVLESRVWGKPPPKLDERRITLKTHPVMKETLERSIDSMGICMDSFRNNVRTDNHVVGAHPFETDNGFAIRFLRISVMNSLKAFLRDLRTELEIPNIMAMTA